MDQLHSDPFKRQLLARLQAAHMGTHAAPFAPCGITTFLQIQIFWGRKDLKPDESSPA